MSTPVAVIAINNEDYPSALRQALDLIGGIGLLNDPSRAVTIKVGIFDPHQQHHTAVPAVGAIAGLFDQAPVLRVAESDNYCGKSLDRLTRFQAVYTDRVIPWSLSDDPDSRPTLIAGELMALSGALFKPNVLVSTHVLRTFVRGSILKNLFGCTPMVQKAKYHRGDIFNNQLADLFEAAGGIDLAVLDGTSLYHGASGLSLPMNLLIVGRDAVAVETVGMVLAGLKPEKMAVVEEFTRRGLGIGSLDQIEIVGVSPAEFKALKQCHRELKKRVDAAPRAPGVSNTIDELTGEGWLDTPRTAQAVTDELTARGVSSATKALVETTLKRRAGKTLERVKDGGGWVYRRRQEPA